MKTMTVKQVADVLGLTKRAIMYRLENGKLKGTRITNQNGVEEWRVYPNKEVISALKSKGLFEETEEQTNFEPDDLSGSAEIHNNKENSSSFKSVVADKGRVDEVLDQVAVRLVKPLTDKLEQQTREIIEKDLLIKEQEKQIKLLPDLQAREDRLAKEEEKRKKEIELKEFELNANKKQIAALEDEVSKAKIQLAEVAEDKVRFEVTVERLKALEEEINSHRESQIKWEKELAILKELSRKEVEEKESKLKEQEEELEDLRKSIQTKEDEYNSKLAEIENELKKYQRPLWKKFFGIE